MRNYYLALSLLVFTSTATAVFSEILGPDTTAGMSATAVATAVKEAYANPKNHQVHNSGAAKWKIMPCEGILICVMLMVA